MGNGQRTNASSKGIGKKIAWGSVGILSLLVAMFLLMPTLLSTGWGKKRVESAIGNACGGSLSIDDLSLSWFGSQSIRGIALKDKSNQSVLRCPRVTGTNSLWAILFSRDLGEWMIESPEYTLRNALPLALSSQHKREKLQALGFVPNMSLATAGLQKGLNGYFGKLQVANGKIVVLSAQVDPITFDEIAIKASLPKTEDQLQIALQCKTVQQQMQGTVNLTAQLSDLGAKIPSVIAQAAIVQLPVRGIDQIVSQFHEPMAGLLLNLIGPTIDMQLDINSALNTFELNLDANSSQFNAHFSTQGSDGIASLKNPGLIKLTMPPLSFKKFSELIPTLKGIVMTQPTTFLLNVSEVEIPMNQELESLKVKATLGTASASTWEVNGQSILLQQFEFNIATSKLSDGLTSSGKLVGTATNQPFQFAYQAQLSDLLHAGPKAKGSLLIDYAPFGSVHCTIEQCTLPSFEAVNKLQLKATVKADQLLFQQFPLHNVQALVDIQTLDQISINLDSDHLKASAQAGLNAPKTALVLKTPLLVAALIDNALYQAWVSPQAMLTQNATLSLSIDPFSLPLDLNQVKTLKINGLAKIPLLDLASSDQSKTIRLTQTEIPFQLNAQAKTIDLSCSSQINPDGAIQLTANLTQVGFSPSFDLSAAKVELSGNFSNIPPALIDAFSKTPQASALIGSSLNCTLKAQSTPNLQTFQIQASSSLLNINAAFTATDELLRLQGGQGQATLTLTPQSYLVIDSLLSGQGNNPSPFSLKESTTFTCNFSDLYAPLQPRSKTGSLSDRIPTLATDLSQLKIVASGKNSLLNVFDKTSQETIQLTNSTFSLNKSQGQGPILFNLSSAVMSTGGKGPGKSGALNIAASIDPTFGKDLSLLSGKVAMTASQFPSRVLDMIARAKGNTTLPFSTIFGETISAEAALEIKELTGPVSLTLNSPNSRLSLKGKLLKGALLLDQPLHAQGKLTAEVSRLFLKEVNPLLTSYVYSQNPITIEIPPTDFYFPLYPFDANRVNVAKARIELGQIYCRNEGNIDATLSLLKNKQFSQDQEIMLWFAPIDLSVRQGIVDIERTEILIANTFDVALWGNVNMTKDFIDMTLGLTAQTLQKAFGIKGLPKDYVLMIAMKGPSDNVKIDSAKATAKIALLLAWQQKAIAGGAAGGPAGALVGEFLGKLATLPDKNAKVPPAKHPFPWEESKSNSRKSTSHAEGKKRHFKKNEKPLKQILKVIR